MSIIINPRHACVERVTAVVSCVCVCLYVCLSAHAILAVRAVRSITKDAIVLSVRFAYEFTAAQKTLLYIIIVIFAENASFKSYAVTVSFACLECH